MFEEASLCPLCLCGEKYVAHLARLPGCFSIVECRVTTTACEIIRFRPTEKSGLRQVVSHNHGAAFADEPFDGVVIPYCKATQFVEAMVEKYRR